MMQREYRNKLTRRAAYSVAFAAFAITFLSSPNNAWAPGCTDPSEIITINLTDSARRTTVKNALDAIVTSTNSVRDAAVNLYKTNTRSALAFYQASFVDGIKNLNAKIMEEGLKPMAMQLSVAGLMATLQEAKQDDAQALQDAEEIKKFRNARSYMINESTNADKRFDSKARYFQTAEKVARSASSAYTTMFTKIVSNKVGSAAEKGKLSLHEKRWNKYKEFCDPMDNMGHAGCEKSGRGDDKNGLTTMPSRTIFGNYTIDFKNNPYMFVALQDLIYNITGYDATAAVAAGAALSHDASINTVEARSYMAQMDVVGSLIYSQVGERFPIATEDGGKTNLIQAIRTAIGAAFPSPTPSLYEIKKTVVEELWTPEYYLDLTNEAFRIEPKEIYLQAYGLMQLNDIIEKQERISEAYAIEAANMLKDFKKFNSNTGETATNKE